MNPRGWKACEYSNTGYLLKDTAPLRTSQIRFIVYHNQILVEDLCSTVSATAASHSLKTDDSPSD